MLPRFVVYLFCGLYNDDDRLFVLLCRTTSSTSPSTTSSLYTIEHYGYFTILRYVWVSGLSPLIIPILLFV